MDTLHYFAYHTHAVVIYMYMSDAFTLNSAIASEPLPSCFVSSTSPRIRTTSLKTTGEQSHSNFLFYLVILPNEKGMGVRRFFYIMFLFYLGAGDQKGSVLYLMNKWNISVDSNDR